MSEVRDSNVEGVIDKLRCRAEVGHIKYGVTTERTDLSLVQWMIHLQEELLDASVYLQKLIAAEEANLKHKGMDG